MTALSTITTSPTSSPTIAPVPDKHFVPPLVNFFQQPPAAPAPITGHTVNPLTLDPDTIARGQKILNAKPYVKPTPAQSPNPTPPTPPTPPSQPAPVFQTPPSPPPATVMPDPVPAPKPLSSPVPAPTPVPVPTPAPIIEAPVEKRNWAEIALIIATIVVILAVLVCAVGLGVGTMGTLPLMIAGCCAGGVAVAATTAAIVERCRKKPDPIVLGTFRRCGKIAQNMLELVAGRVRHRGHCHRPALQVRIAVRPGHFH